MTRDAKSSPETGGRPAWFEALHHPGAYPHPVERIELLETHLSWVFLTGNWVYKLKKPIQLPFVDFSTPERRRACCEEELRLNRRTAPEIYKEVVSLVETEAGPRFGQDGPVLESAVLMRQFPQSDVLLARTKARQLTEELIDPLSRSIWELHRDAARASEDSAFGLPATIDRYTRECVTRIAQAELTAEGRAQLQMLDAWVSDTHRRLEPHFRRRKREGFVRECHGDLHLGNLVVIDGAPRPFDCIEFNPELRFIDVVSDVAFLAMDLFDHQLPQLAWRLLNGWLCGSGDFEGLKGLRYYEVYRALVRAKVAAIRLTQPGLDQSAQEATREQLAGYLGLSVQLAEHRAPALVLMHGLSGSGKSFVARRLMGQLGAICLRSDVERKRLQEGAAASTKELYSPEAMGRTYAHMRDVAGMLLKEGLSVIVDATFLKGSDRDSFRKVAEDARFPWAILSCEAPDHVLQRRIQDRQAARNDPSDATLAVLELQKGQLTPLTPSERSRTVVCRTDMDNTMGEVLTSLKRLLTGG